jgi:tRNA dimethylallyltransferase
MTIHTCLVIAGPTAAGKTALSIALAQHFNTEIISADSRQCYRELNIGVAKPSQEELQSVPHYFINSHSIQDGVNVKIFETYALEKLFSIFHKKPVAIVVGGTGLYLDALYKGIDDIPVVKEDINEEINTAYKQNGIEWLQQKIALEDELYAAKGEIKNPFRLIRALAIKRTTGQSILNFQTKTKKIRPFKIIKIGLDLPREILYNRINTRVDNLIETGLYNEVKSLLPFRHLQALQTVGYREFFEHIDGKISFKEAMEKIKINSRHYAKRQLTWFKRDEDIKWINAEDFNQMFQEVIMQLS